MPLNSEQEFDAGTASAARAWQHQMDTEVVAVRGALAKRPTWEEIKLFVSEQLDDLETSLRQEYDVEIESLQREVNELRNETESDIIAAVEGHERDYDHDSL